VFGATAAGGGIACGGALRTGFFFGGTTLKAGEDSIWAAAMPVAAVAKRMAAAAAAQNLITSITRPSAFFCDRGVLNAARYGRVKTLGPGQCAVFRPFHNDPGALAPGWPLAILLS
jgi:hypothetical protein